MKCYAQLFLLSAFVVAATCFRFRANDDGLAWKSMAEDVWMYDNADKDKLTIDKFVYKVEKAPKQYCILANMTISLTFPQSNDTKPLNVPSDAVVEGTCSSLISELKLSWKETAEDVNTIKFTFINDHTTFSVFSIDVDIALVNKNVFDTGKSRFKRSSENDLRLFRAPAKNGIHTCSEKKTKVGEMDVTISNVSLIAFYTEGDISERTEKKCSDKEDEDKTFPYTLRNSTGSACTLAKWTIVLDIPYKMKDNQMATATVKVPSKVNVTGQCYTTSSQMNIIWTETTPPAASGTENSVSFVFTKNETNSFVQTMTANIYIEEKNFPGAADLGKRVKVNTLLEHLMFLAEAENGVYSCEDVKKVEIDGVTVSISDVILVAFDGQKELASKRVTDCRYVFSVDDFDYIVYDTATSIPCTLARMNITMNVPYTTTTNTNTSKVLAVPSKLKADGVCDVNWPSMMITWPSSLDKNSPNNVITFHIARDDKSTNFYIYRIDTTVQLDSKNFPDVLNEKRTLNGSTNSVMLFPADASDGLYRCRETIHHLKAGVIDLNITDVLFVAYNNKMDLNKKKVNECSALQTTTELPTEKTTESTTEKTTESTTEKTTESTTESTTLATNATTIASTPTPDPSVQKYDYVVTNPETHIPCVLASMTIQLTIPYKTKDSKDEKKTLQVPYKAETQGTCEDTTATMNLIWTPEVPKYETVQNTVTFIFQSEKSIFHLQSVSVDFNLDEKNFPDATDRKCNVTTRKLNVFSASTKNVYRCSTATVLDAGDVQIRIENIALIAFNTEKSVASKSEVNCDIAVETDTNVGAIVGGTIGGVFLLGIIVYVFISWRRGRIYR